MQTGTRRVRRFSTLSRCLWLWRCHHHVKCVNHPDEYGLSVRIPHVCNHVGRYCGKIGPKRNWELPRENMHLTCRDEYSKRKCDRRCVVCNEESVWGHSCGGDDGLSGTGYPIDGIVFFLKSSQ